MNFKISLLAISLSLFLFGCGTQEDESTVVDENQNNAPSLVVSTIPLEINESQEVRIPYSTFDSDGDVVTLNVNITPQIGSVEINEDNVVYTPELISEDTLVRLTFIASDGIESSTRIVEVNVLNLSNETPTLSLDTNDFLYFENSTERVSFSASDLDGDELSFTLTEDSISGVSIVSTIDTIAKEIVFEVGNVFGEVATASYTLSVSDGQDIVSENISITVEDLFSGVEDLISSLDDAEEKFDSVEDKNDEVEIFDFFYTVASYTNENVLVELDILRNSLVDSLNNERIELSDELSQIRDYIADENRDESLINDYIDRIEQFILNVDNFGLNAVRLLNDSSSLINQNLPLINEDSIIERFEVDNVVYYSRYVGNNDYGKFVDDNFIFTDEFKFMQSINFLTTECLFTLNKETEK